MSTKISDLTNGNALEPTDWIPVVRNLQNFKVSAGNIISGRKFCVLTHDTFQTIAYRPEGGYQTIKLNLLLGGQLNWYDTSETGQFFKPGEIGFYRLSGCFMFSYGGSVPGNFEFLIYRTNSSTNPGGQQQHYRQTFYGFTNNFETYSQKFLFDDTIEVRHPQDTFYFQIAMRKQNTTDRDPYLTITNGHQDYNRWHLVIEKL